ncbi:MAG: universal stress protein [Chloroflexota bacterium]
MSDGAINPRRILVPLDMNRLSEGKVPNSEAFARAFGAELVLLHVITSPPPTTGRVTMQESQALTYLYAIAASLRADGVVVHTLVRYGSPAEVILDEIANQQADLVILGPNVRRNLPALFGNAIADVVIARSPVPVLLVPASATERVKPAPVRNFDEDMARTGAVAPRELGLRTVAISRIVGSVGRAGELDSAFRIVNPSRQEVRRYERIRELMEQGAPVPPIALYKLGYGYYVLDGNHRVAAAKELGQLEIEAEVTEFLPLEDPQSQRVFVERRRFESATGLMRVGAAQPGSYPVLEAMINEFARVQGIADIREAARLWEAQVYRPVVRRLRQLRLGHRFADMRTADVFIQLSDFRDQALESEGDELSWEDAIQRFRLSRVATV